MFEKGNGQKGEGTIEGENMSACNAILKKELKEKHNAGTGHVTYWEVEPKDESKKGGKK
jgi:hypothetical protein